MVGIIARIFKRCSSCWTKISDKNKGCGFCADDKWPYLKYDTYCPKCKHQGSSYCMVCVPNGSGESWCYFEKKTDMSNGNSQI